MVIPELTQALGLRKFQEKINLFNAASGGTITLAYDPGYLAQFGGDYIKPVVFARTSGVDTHVDEADPTGADTAVALVQAAGASVHQSRRAYVKWNRDEVMRGKMSPEAFSVAIAEECADSKLKALRDNMLGMAVAAIDSMDTPSANYHILDVDRGQTGGAKVTCTHAYLNTLLAKIGDAREEITTLVMHSAVFADLVGDSISTYKIENVGGMTLVKDVVQAFGRNIIVVDSSSLYSALTSSYYTQYFVLGLGAGALRATIVSEDDFVNDVVTTTKVKSWTTRQDYDVNFAVGGMKYVVGTINPTDAELATAGSWNEDLSDHRECKIVKGIFNAS